MRYFEVNKQKEDTIDIFRGNNQGTVSLFRG